MLEAIGIAAVALAAALAVFYAAILVMDRLRWWARAGLAAFIPMLAVSVPMSVCAAGIVVWLLS